LRRLLYLASVQTDLVEILTYIATESGSVKIGQDFIGQLRKNCRDLAALPGVLGRARPELHPDIRSSALKGYVIFFRYVDNRVEVINILHGHRDIETHFSEKPWPQS